MMLSAETAALCDVAVACVLSALKIGSGASLFLKGMLSAVVACCRKVRVLKVTPGRAVAEQYPDFDPAMDYYYSQTHAKRCISNEDCYQDWSMFSDLYKAVSIEGPIISNVASLCSDGGSHDTQTPGCLTAVDWHVAVEAGDHSG